MTVKELKKYLEVMDDEVIISIEYEIDTPYHYSTEMVVEDVESVGISEKSFRLIGRQ